VVLAEFLFLFLRHTTGFGLVTLRTGKRIVVTSKLTFQLCEGLSNDLFELATLVLGARRRKRNALHTTARTNAGRDNVVCVNDRGVFDLGTIHITWVHSIGSIPAVALINDGVEQLLERFVTFNVTGSHTNGLDGWVARVFDTSLDALVQRHTVCGNATFQVVVKLFVQVVGHATSMAFHSCRVVVKLDLDTVDVDLVSRLCQKVGFCFFDILPGAVKLMARVFASPFDGNSPTRNRKVIDLSAIANCNGNSNFAVTFAKINLHFCRGSIDNSFT